MKKITNNLITLGLSLSTIFVFSAAILMPGIASAHVFGQDGVNVYTNDYVTPFQPPVQPIPNSYNTITVNPNPPISVINKINTNVATNPIPVIYSISPNVNPLPVVDSISPNSTNAGSNSMTITITGVNFIPSSIAEWNDSYRQTSYIDSTHLVMTLNNSDFAIPGIFPVTVYNPAPGGGLSNEKDFTVQNGTSSTNLNLGANAFFAGFMPRNAFEWILLFLIILLLILLVRKMLKKKKVTLTASNITATSATLHATGLTPDGTYVFQLTGPLGPNKVQVIAGNDGAASSSYSNLTPGSHYTATLSKYDPHTNFLSNAGAPVLYFDTFKQA